MILMCFRTEKGSRNLQENVIAIIYAIVIVMNVNTPH